MISVLLIHPGNIPHYRISIYNYLSCYLKLYGFDFMVVSNGIQADSPHSVDFSFTATTLSVQSISRLILKKRIEIIIDFMELRHLYLFPTYLIAKGIMGRKIIYWGQGCDLAHRSARIKNMAYATEQAMSDAIILYAEHLKKYVPARFHSKVFIANNTLYMDYQGLPPWKKKEDVLAEYGIKTRKNIICVGRMQKRKRLEHLFEAFELLNRSDIGLILVGPDPEGILNSITGDNIYKLGPLYERKKMDLLSSSDVYCLPGAVGLSIVDAFYCGLPLVTEEGDESAEIMYVKDGVNGFIVQRGNILELSQKLLLLLDNSVLQKQFSDAAIREIRENGSIDKLCTGFRDALCYVTNRTCSI